MSALKDDANTLLSIPCAFHRLENIYIEKFCKGVKLEPARLNCKAVFEDWDSILKFVEAENGFAVVPGFIKSSSSVIRDFDISHSMIPRSVYYAVFHRKLKSIESFKKVLNFAVRDS